MGLAVIGLFFFLFLLGFPVVLAIIIPSIAYIVTMGVPIVLIAQRIHYSLADSYTLIAVPVFIFTGMLMNSAGVTTRIFRFADTLVGRMPGGLTQVNIVGNLIFSGMSGAALADVGGIGQVLMKAMKDKGFSSQFSAAVTIAGATVGPIFPPSIPLVIFGAITGVSIVKLLLAGIIPAILATTLMMITSGILALRRGFPRAERWPTWGELLRGGLPALPALLAPVVLVGGMITGIFTPTEAASVALAYIMAISLLVYREMRWCRFVDAVLETVKMSAAILLIVASASVFGWILAVQGIPQMLSSLLLMVSHNPMVLLLEVNILLLIVGMFLDSTTATLLVIPMLMAPLLSAGINPVHFGLIAVFNLMIGLITPPMGLSLFLIADISKASISSILREVWPYLITLLVTLALLTYIPALSLWIPNIAVH